MSKSRPSQSGAATGPIVYTIFGIAAAVGMLFLGTSGQISESLRDVQDSSANLQNGLTGTTAEAAPPIAVPQPLPAPLAINPNVRSISPRSFTPVYPVRFNLIPSTPRVEPSNGTTQPTDPIEPEVVKTPALLPPDDVSVVAFLSGMSVYVFWSTGKSTEKHNPADETLYIVERRAAGQEQWARITPQPIDADRFIDSALVPGVEYTYAVTAVARDTEIAGRVGSTVIANPERMPVTYATSNRVASSEVVSMPAPGAPDWWIVGTQRNPETRGAELNVRLRKWYARQIPFTSDWAWHRLTVEVTGIGTGQPIGTTYNTAELLRGEGTGVKLALTVEFFKDGKLVKLEDEREIRSGLEFEIDFSTGLVFASSSSNEIVVTGPNGRQTIPISSRHVRTMPREPEAPRHPREPAPEPEQETPENGGSGTGEGDGMGNGNGSGSGELPPEDE